MEAKSEEKRRSPRLTLRTPMRYQVRGVSSFDNALSDNIGKGGMAFISDRFIAPSTTVMLEINILSRILRPVGRIAWSSTIPRSNRNRLGIEFIELDPKENNFLRDYVDMQMGQL